MERLNGWHPSGDAIVLALFAQLIAIPLGSLIASAGIVLVNWSNPTYSYGVLTSTVNLALFGGMIATPVAILYGVPMYGLWARFGRSSILVLALIGALPGALAAIWQATIGAICAAFGIAIALCTHMLVSIKQKESDTLLR